MAAVGHAGVLGRVIADACRRAREVTARAVNLANAAGQARAFLATVPQPSPSPGPAPAPLAPCAVCM